MAAYSDTSLRYKAYSLNLLTFGDSAGSHEGIWYLGVNRVVSPYDKSYAEGNRDGEGLCSVCIRWKAGQNLDPPDETPTVPNPSDSATPPPEPPKDCMESATCKVCCKFVD